MIRSSDEELITQLKDGGESAFSAFYNALWEPLFTYVMRVLQDSNGAMDVVQETFAAIWLQRDRIVEAKAVRSYIFSIARHKALRHIRLNIMHRDYLSSLRHFFEQYAVTPEQQLATNELKHLVDEQVSQLPPRMREVFRLSRDENLSHKEIAERLQISANTVKKQINHSLKILRLKLSNEQFFFLLVALLLA